MIFFWKDHKNIQVCYIDTMVLVVADALRGWDELLLGF